MKVCTPRTTGRAFLAGCLLLTLLFLSRFYHTLESINSHFLSVSSVISTGDKPTRHLAPDGNPKSVTERNMLTVNKSVKKNSLGLEAEPVPGERHIIFLETRCVLNDSVTGNQSGLAISQRQACAVASAANTNPDNKVYLVYTCSIIGNLSDSPEYVKQMLSYPNVRIWKLDISDYFKGTPLETWDFLGKIRSSNWAESHASDVLRFITLWKYGGTYLDMDFVIQKSLVEIGTNYAGAQSESYLAAGALNFDMDPVGRKAIDLMVSDIQKNFNGKIWGQNGPAVVNRVLQGLCGTKNVTNTTREKCSGIAILPPCVFYCIFYPSWRLLFYTSRSVEVLKKVEGSYGVHIWNYMSKKEKIIVGSKQAYGLLAEKYCPGVYRNCGPVF